jgi:hypothetical protein
MHFDKSTAAPPPRAQLLFAIAEPESRRNHRTGVITRRKIPDFNSPFRDLLTKLNLRFVPGVNEPRTLYSLRHYYANTQIMVGRDIYRLAKRMGTSVKMIELYNGSAIERRESGLAAGYLDSGMDQLRSRLARAQVRDVIERDSNVEEWPDPHTDGSFDPEMDG